MEMNEEKTESLSEEAKDKKIKNLISISVLLGGLFIGSLFVDGFQMVRGEGFSQKVLNKADIFSLGNKTWVAYSEPIIKVQVLTDDLCEACNPEEAILGLKRELPTVLTEKVDFNSEDGKNLISKIGIKTIPAFVFSKEIENTPLFVQAQTVFEKKEDVYLLNSVAVGLPVGKYTNPPSSIEGDMTTGPEDAKVKIVQFSDFQCPYCKEMHETVISKILAEYGEKVQFVFKNLPLSFHAQAENASLATQCASEQGKFIEFADKLFSTQDTWGATTGTQSFKNYAAQLKLNTADFNECLDSKKYSEKIASDVLEAQSFGITGTPGTFINDKFSNGLVPYEEFKSIIEAELAK